MSEQIIYTLKPAKQFHPATGSSSGQPMSGTCNESRGSELPSPGVTLTPAPVEKMEKLALDKGGDWCRILRDVRRPDASGKTLLQKHSLAEAATIVGTSAPTLSRLLKKFGQLSDVELTPERVAPVRDGGKESDWKFLLDQPEVRAKLLEIYVATMGASSAQAASDRRTAKLSRTFLHFSYEQECPAALASRLRLGYQPTDFVKFLRAGVTPEVEARIRGKKHEQLYGQSARRDWTFRTPTGERGEVPAAWTPSADDMSENHPFWVDYQGEPILSRQGLYAIFAKHKFWQSCELVARVRESYRAEDILRFFFGMCQAIGGVPPYIEFEQGIWKSKMISGWRMDGNWLLEETIARPGMAESEMQIVTEGLGLCGVKVCYQYSAHTKHVETHFNPLQTDIAVVARKFQHIGRYAGEYEFPGKQLRRVRAGSHHPRDIGFASQAELADCIEEAMRRSRQQPSDVTRDGKVLSREEAHWADLAKCPLLPITDRLFAACLPGALKPNTVRNGYVQVRVRGVDYQYREERFAALGDGYEVYYKIDETNPNAGIAVYNRTSQSNSANFNGWKPGEFMFTAAREIPGPQFNLTTAPAGIETQTVEEIYGPGAVDRGDMVLRKQKKFVATQARHAPRPGQIPVRTASARDGKGNVVEVTNVAAPLPPAGSNPAAALPPRPVRVPGLFAPKTPEQLQKQSRKFSRMAANANRLRELSDDTVVAH